MRIEALVAGLASVASLASTAQGEPAWHNLSISAPEHGRYLHRTESRDPFFWQADTAWELLHKLNKTSIDWYLRTRASQGYNVVQTVVIAELNGTTRTNFYGDLPINDSDPTRPNEAYFELVDWASEQAASYGILLALVPTWGKYVSGGWESTESIFNETSARVWGEYIGARYPGLPKIIGGDTNVIWSRNISKAMFEVFPEDTSVDPVSLMAPLEDTSGIWKSMRAGLVEAEGGQGYESLVIYHPSGGWFVQPEDSPRAYGHNMLPDKADRVSVDAVQSGHALPDTSNRFTPWASWDSTKNYEAIAEMRDRFTGPVLDLENHYEGAHVGFNAALPYWNASHVRTGLYHGVYSGAAGFTYGANSVWQMYEPLSDLLRASDYYAPRVRVNATTSWRRDLDLDGAWQIQFVTKPLQGMDIDALEQLEPARELLDSVSGDTGAAVNTFEGTRYISVLASATRDRYFVYTGHGDAFSLELALGSGSSSRSGTARWFSPRDGEIHGDAIPLTVSSGGNDTRVDFYPPSSGAVDFDWLLIVEF